MHQINADTSRRIIRGIVPRKARKLRQSKNGGRGSLRIADSPLRDGPSKEDIESLKQEMEHSKPLTMKT